MKTTGPSLALKKNAQFHLVFVPTRSPNLPRYLDINSMCHIISPAIFLVHISKRSVFKLSPVIISIASFGAIIELTGEETKRELIPMENAQSFFNVITSPVFLKNRLLDLGSSKTLKFVTFLSLLMYVHCCYFF